MNHQEVQYMVCSSCNKTNRLRSRSDENMHKVAVCGHCKTPLHQEPISELSMSDIQDVTKAMQDRMDKRLYDLGAINEDGASPSGFGDYLGILFLILFFGGIAMAVFFWLFELVF